VASQLEVAILERAREHRTFRRIRAARLEELISESAALAPEEAADSAETAAAGDAATAGSAPSAPSGSPAGPSTPADSGPPTGPDPSSSDRGSGLSGPPL
jgi:proteasome alpha subunit